MVTIFTLAKEKNLWLAEKWSGWNRTNRTGGYAPAFLWQINPRSVLASYFVTFLWQTNPRIVLDSYFVTFLWQINLRSGLARFCTSKNFCAELRGAILWLLLNMNGVQDWRCSSQIIDRSTGSFGASRQCTRIIFETGRNFTLTLTHTAKCLWSKYYCNSRGRITDLPFATMHGKLKESVHTSMRRWRAAERLG